MKDPRLDKLADVIVGHSTQLQNGEKILIEAIDIPSEMVTALMRKVKAAGGQPFVTIKQNVILRELYSTATEESMKLTGELEAARMK